VPVGQLPPGPADRFLVYRDCTKDYMDDILSALGQFGDFAAISLGKLVTRFAARAIADRPLVEFAQPTGPKSASASSSFFPDNPSMPL